VALVDVAGVEEGAPAEPAGVVDEVDAAAGEDVGAACDADGDD